MKHTEGERLPEETQVEELRIVADLGARRAELLRQADELVPPMRAAALRAIRAGASRRRTQDLAQIGASTFYKWLADDGVVIRSKRTSKSRSGGQDQQKSA